MSKENCQRIRYNKGMKKTFLLLVLALLILPTTFLKAQEVDLLWQGENYVPPFYKGRTLWSSQSRITLVAIPHGLGNPASLNYKWTKTGTVLGNLNGIGKNTISFLDSILSKPQTIKVEIISSSSDEYGQKTVLASASTKITPLTPSLYIYENNPLYGFKFNKEVGNTYKLEGKEVTFTAFPFFFSVFDRTDDVLKYEWGTNVGGTDTGSSVTYRTPDDAKGASSIRARVSNTYQVTQFANKNFLIQYENN